MWRLYKCCIFLSLAQKYLTPDEKIHDVRRMAGLYFAEPARNFSEICGYKRRATTQYFSPALRNSARIRLDSARIRSSPKNSWAPDPSLKNNARIGSRSEHDPRASGGPAIFGSAPFCRLSPEKVDRCGKQAKTSGLTHI